MTDYHFAHRPLEEQQFILNGQTSNYLIGGDPHAERIQALEDDANKKAKAFRTYHDVQSKRLKRIEENQNATCTFLNKLNARGEAQAKLLESLSNRLLDLTVDVHHYRDALRFLLEAQATKPGIVRRAIPHLVTAGSAFGAAFLCL